MATLTESLHFAKLHRETALEITQDSPEKPSNVHLFNHVFSDDENYTAKKEAFLIEGSVLWFPNLKSLFGGIIMNPEDQYVFVDEAADCIAIGGRLTDQQGSYHIFGTHVYTSLVDYQMKTILKIIIGVGLIPDKVIYSPREDTESSYKKGFSVLQPFFPHAKQVLRPKGNVAELIVGVEGMLLNGEEYSWSNSSGQLNLF